jgi:hypothetical protein
MDKEWIVILLFSACHIAPILGQAMSETHDVGGCVALTVTELGSMGSFSQRGLIAQYLTEGQGGMAAVRVLEFMVICEATRSQKVDIVTGERRGVTRASVWVRYECQGEQCPDGRLGMSEEGEHRQLFLAECVGSTGSSQYRLEDEGVASSEERQCHGECRE